MARVKIGLAAKMLGVSVQTLRKWEHTGELLPDYKSEKGTRYYDTEKFQVSGVRNLYDIPTRDLLFELLRRNAAATD